MTAKIKLNAASGGGSFSLQAPSSSSNNRVITLPDIADGTLLTSSSTTGKILQVVQAVKTSTASTSTGVYNAITQLQPALTPNSASNKILVTLDLKLGCSNVNADVNLKLFRSVGGTETQIYLGDTSSSRVRTFFGGENFGTYDTSSMISVGSTFLDSPNTTSAVTYLVKWAIQRGSTYLYINRTGQDNDSADDPRTASSVTLMEVAA